MSTPSVSAFKKAIQLLTTTVVKAESCDPDSVDFTALKTAGLEQLEQLLEMHAVLAAGADPDAKVRTHDSWFNQTVDRARAIFGVEQSSS